ncbi:putative exported protein, partial [Ehrlichia ruminantium]
MFVRVLNTLLILICCFIISCSNKTKYQFSRKYSPVYNPGGESFESNQEFSRAYSVYKERRDALVRDDNQQNVSKKKYVRLGNKHINRYDPIEDDGLPEGKDLQLMVDSNGINLADVAGARFIQSIDDDYENDNVIKKHNDVEDKSGKLPKKNMKHVSSKSVSKKLDVKEKLLDDHVPVEEKYETVEEDKTKLSTINKSSELDKSKVHVKEDKSKSLPDDKSKSDTSKLSAIKEGKAKVSVESKSSELDKSKVHVKEDKSKSLPEDKSKSDTSKFSAIKEDKAKVSVESKSSELDKSKVHVKEDKSKSLP